MLMALTSARKTEELESGTIIPNPATWPHGRVTEAKTSTPPDTAH